MEDATKDMDTHELIQELVDKVENRYALAIIAAKRARLLNLGAEKQVDIKSNKLATIALLEALHDKVTYRNNPKPQKGKKKASP